MSTTAPDDVRSRVVMILAATDPSSPELDAAVRAVGAVALDRVGEGGTVRLGVRLPDDPLSAAMGERRELEPVDAVVEITAADRVSPLDTAGTVEGMLDALGESIDPQRCAVIAGSCYRFLSAAGPLFIALAGYRDPAISMDELTEWWLHRHGPLALSIVEPLPLAYEQLHADQDASRAASEASGLPTQGYDMYDTIAIDSLESLEGSVMNPEVAVQLFEDEVGHVDHSRMRGAIQRTVQ